MNKFQFFAYSKCYMYIRKSIQFNTGGVIKMPVILFSCYHEIVARQKGTISLLMSISILFKLYMYAFLFPALWFYCSAQGRGRLGKVLFQSFISNSNSVKLYACTGVRVCVFMFITITYMSLMHCTDIHIYKHYIRACKILRIVWRTENKHLL